MFIQRNESNVIIGVFAQPQPGYAEEELPDDDPEIAEFEERAKQGQS